MLLDLFCGLLILSLLFCVNFINRFDFFDFFNDEKQSIIVMIIILIFINTYNKLILNYFIK